MFRRLAAIVLLLASIALPAFAPAAEEPPKPQVDQYELYRLLADAVDQVERNYVKEVDRRELIEGAIQGMLAKLDPYSAYVPPQNLNQFKTHIENRFGGVGLQLAVDNGQLMVLSPLAGTPAYRAGIHAGDRIAEIAGRSADGMTIEEAARLLQGKEGTTVEITVVRPGSSEKEQISLTRQVIHVETVLGDRHRADGTWDYMLDPESHLGYVRITAFSRDTPDELQRALEQLKLENARGLILDLRFNPGGLLTAAVRISDMFLSQGRIVSTQGRNSAERAWEAKSEGVFEEFPMVVLVNRFSASASEIVSACLQDNKRAVIVGERTWGKGSVQSVIPMERGRSALKLTTAAYRRPSGKNIHRFPGAKDQQEWGVTPDEGFLLKLSDGETRALVQARRQRDVLLPAHAQGEQLQAASQRPADRQLQMAVDYLAAELAEAREE